LKTSSGLSVASWLLEPIRRYRLIRRIVAIAFIFCCTTVAWIVLGTTISMRTGSSNEQLQGHVASTWGTAQEQRPVSATFKKMELSAVTEQEHGNTVIRSDRVERHIPLPLDSTRVNVNLKLDHRQKGLLWYATYAVDFTGEYKFRNDSAETQLVDFLLPFPAEHAVYDGLQMKVNGKEMLTTTAANGASVSAQVEPGQIADVQVAYHSQGLNSWRYRLGEGIAEVRDFGLTMTTNFKDIDFADDTLSPTAKEQQGSGWRLGWQYSNLISGFQIGMTMPGKLQPGPLAGEISYFAPVSLFFFFFLMFILTTLRNIDLHPMNYFFLATAFFAFHLLLAYLVDHISIHIAMIIASLVSIALVVSYLRLVVGTRFAAVEAGLAQFIYLVLFSYAFFWKGYTGLSITIISILTLFVVMQATGRVRWSERLGGLAPSPMRG
jgi:inner membrane protein involved in colicin E2 resistance